MAERHQSIYLREITEGDVALINGWRRDRDIADSLGGTFKFSNLESDQEWFAAYCKSRDRNVRLGIVLRDSDELIGVAYILGIDWVNRSAEYGSLIGAKEHQGKGYGTAAERLALEHAFMDLNLHRMYCTALADNSRAIHMDEKNGFRREGVMREASFKNGVYKDVVMLGMTRQDFIDLHG